MGAWYSLEFTPACHAGGRGFESRRPRHNFGQIAQSVEHLSEKQGVGSSILPLATGFLPNKNKTVSKFI